MPVGEAFDMGRAADGTPLIDPLLFDSAEFKRNPYPYYRILRDHHPVFRDKLHNCYWVTRYEDIEACYIDEAGFNTIPKGSSSGVLGNTQLELSGVEHRRRRNIYGRHLVGAALTKRLPALQRLAEEMIESWFEPGGAAELDPATGRYTIEFGRAFANEFPIRVVCQVLGFPDEARDRFFYWYHSMMNGLGGAEGHERGLEPAGSSRSTSRVWSPPGAAAELPVRRRRQPGGDGHHLRAVPLGDRRRRDVDRGDHVVHRLDRRRRRRDDPRRDAQHVVPASAAPRAAAGRAGRRGAVGPGVPGGAALRHADRRPPAAPQHLRRRAARRVDSRPDRCSRWSTTPPTTTSGCSAIRSGSTSSATTSTPARSCAAATTRRVATATWRSASAPTSARGRGSRHRSRCSARRSSVATCGTGDRRRPDAQGHRRHQPGPDRVRGDRRAVDRVRPGLIWHERRERRMGLRRARESGPGGRPGTT